MAENTSGWDSLTEVVAKATGDSDPVHWGTGTAIPGQDGIWGVSAFRQPDHWLYVSYGLTELFDKVSEDLETSGWGMESTLRLSRNSDADAPPEWPAALLARLGELVYQRSTPFEPGGRMEVPDAAGGPPPALAWASDPVLPEFESDNGRAGFVATVGITADTLSKMRNSSTDSVLDEIRRVNPLLICQSEGLTW